MPAQLKQFSTESHPLRIFYTDLGVVMTSFEDYQPTLDSVKRFSPDVGPKMLPRLCWITPCYEYHPYLPKKISYDGHLLAPLKHQVPTSIQRDGMWYVDDKTRNAWESLDANLTVSISVVHGKGCLVPVDHHEPQRAIKSGFARGHKTEQNLLLSLEASRHAFIHRLAYLAYLIAHRYRWGQELPDHPWWQEFTKCCGRAWVDSVWEVIYRQWSARNFVGVVIRPLDHEYDFRWYRKVLQFGVPIWVLFKSYDSYTGVLGTEVISQWKPTIAQVQASEELRMARLTTQPAESTLPPSHLQPHTEPPPQPQQDHPPPGPPNDPPASHPEPLSPPAQIPKGARWYKSWEIFFQDRDKGDVQRLEMAAPAERTSWNDRAKHAEGYHQPSKAKVYEWEACDTGGFLRVPVTRADVANNWDLYFKKALTYHPISDTWDHCPFRYEPAVEEGPPDDLNDDDDDDYVMRPWYAEPDRPATLPNDDSDPLKFLYDRYGFLSVEPTASPGPGELLPFSKDIIARMVGLDTDILSYCPEHLPSFVSSIYAGKLPSGHCDLSPTSPSNETFTESGRSLIHDTVYSSKITDLSDNSHFIFANSLSDPILLVMHESLSVLQMARVGTVFRLWHIVEYLLCNGSGFTLLYAQQQRPAPPRFNILLFPTHEGDWEPGLSDFEVYMSRLKIFFFERPYMVAAALSRGGIAWRIAREVLGIEGSAETLLNTLPDQGSSMSARGGAYWFHEPQEGEWFYLVGGYETFTGKGSQIRDVSWWPKVTIWEGSGLDVGCWTPMCERWFQKRLGLISSGTPPYSTAKWKKSITYEGNKKVKFFNNAKVISERFLYDECRIQGI